MAHARPVLRFRVSNKPQEDLIHLSPHGIVWLSSEHGQIEIKNDGDEAVYLRRVYLDEPVDSDDHSVYEAA